MYPYDDFNRRKDPTPTEERRKLRCLTAQEIQKMVIGKDVDTLGPTMEKQKQNNKRAAVPLES